MCTLYTVLHTAAVYHEYTVLNTATVFHVYTVHCIAYSCRLP